MSFVTIRLLDDGGARGDLLAQPAMEACFRAHDRWRAIASRLHLDQGGGSGPRERFRPRVTRVLRVSFFRRGGPWPGGCAAARRGGLRRIALRTMDSADSYLRSGAGATEIF